MVENQKKRSRGGLLSQHLIKLRAEFPMKKVIVKAQGGCACCERNEAPIVDGSPSRRSSSLADCTIR